MKLKIDIIANSTYAEGFNNPKSLIKEFVCYGTGITIHGWLNVMTILKR